MATPAITGFTVRGAIGEDKSFCAAGDLSSGDPGNRARPRRGAGRRSRTVGNTAAGAFRGASGVSLMRSSPGGGLTRRVAAEERGRSRIVSGAVTGFAIVAVVVTAVVTGAIALFVAATVSAVPALFLTCGFLASLAVLYGGIALVARWRWPPGRRRAARRIVF